MIANTLKQALSQKDKLLLTATPLQNSLLELFGLVSFIDEHTFGDLKSFREQFANLSQDQVFRTLRARLQPICHRTLRRQVTAYIPYTYRLPLIEEFTPEESEDRLYHLVSEYLRRDNLQALPASQRSLMTLVLRKLLASSTFAIAGALESISNRLKLKLKKHEPAEPLEEELEQDYELLDETAEEWPDDQPIEILPEADRAAIEQEVADLDSFAQLATSIDHNAKGKALLKALDVAFRKTAEIGAAQKAIIFTESRRTQNYLLRVLGDSAFNDGIVLFNGSNTDPRSKEIYAAWFERHQGTDRVSGSKTADMRSALVDYFREEGRIMIATEAGAEGINLQFCSLVVNYDLPWNPQRIEQRIGRCHRYGQKHDVVHIIPRLKKVIDGADSGGITEAVGWKGGGGFRYYRLAPSLLAQDKWGNWVISKEFNAPMLAEAVCKLEGFTYAPSDTVYWQHGHSTERDFLYVTTANLNHDQLQQLSDEVGSERSLLVVCSAFRGRKEGFANLTVKKIPKAVLTRCEWGHDDYSLKVENLPKAPPRPGELFAEAELAAPVEKRKP